MLGRVLMVLGVVVIIGGILAFAALSATTRAPGPTATAQPTSAAILTPTAAPTLTPSAPVATATPAPTATATSTSTATRVPTPSAKILSVTMQPTLLSSGDLLAVTVVVQNTGPVSICSQGPFTGNIYNEGDVFSVAEVLGCFRVGIDYAGRSQQADHPYRWGWVGELAPGQTVELTGLIRLQTPRTNTVFWAGLVEEGVAWVQDDVGATGITVVALTPTPTAIPTATATRVPVASARLVSVVMQPTTLFSGNLLEVDFVVQNTGSVSLCGQGPVSGYTYDEGTTFPAGGAPGCLRVAVDYDGRTQLTDHPYRWGWSGQLDPGQTVQIAGFIRLTAPRVNTTFWAGLVDEGVAWIQDYAGAAAITVIGPTPTPTMTPTGVPIASARIVSVVIHPTTLSSGNTLEVDFVVQNTGSVSLCSQGPFSGYVYDEGTTVPVADVPGCFRVAIDYDGRTQPKDHPYRWGWSGQLDPGQMVQINGFIRLTTPRVNTSFWAGLVDEGVAWIQDNLGATAITVIAQTATATPTPTATRTPTQTSVPTQTPTLAPTSTPTRTPAPTSTPTRTPAPTSTPTRTPAPTSTPTHTPAPTSTPTHTQVPTITPTTTPVLTPGPGNDLSCDKSGRAEICAWVSEAEPVIPITVTVYGRLLIDGLPQAGLQMTTTWQIDSSRMPRPHCVGVTDETGVARCSVYIRSRSEDDSGATIGVIIGGYRAMTWFVPQVTR